MSLSDLINLEPWWRFAVALFIGALIGIEREFVQQRAGSAEFAGIRTFSLISLFGALAAFIAEYQGLIVFVVAYIGFVLLVVGSRAVSLLRGQTEGMTTEVVAIFVPLLGALVIWDFAEIAAALAVVTALTLALKRSLHDVARRMTAEDLRATLQFALISLVILPLLPNRTLDPLEVFNPFEVWLLVILVSGLSFSGYLLIKLLGAQRGTGLAGIFGGLVSSTATAASFSSQSKENPHISYATSLAVILGSTVMYPRILIEVLVVHSPLALTVGLPMLAMSLSGLLPAAILWRRRPQDDSLDPQDVALSNPLRFGAALGFALLFTVVLFVVKLGSDAFGPAGLYSIGALSGLTGVDSITLSASSLASDGQIGLQAAAGTIVLASVVNTILKATLVRFMGSRNMSRIVLPIFGLMAVTGVASAVLLLWMGS